MIEKNELLKEYIKNIFKEEILKIIISNKSNKNYKFKKITIEKKEKKYYISKYTEKQVFNENIELNAIKEYIYNFTNEFKQYNLFSKNTEHILRITKKGKIIYGKSKVTNNIEVSTKNNRQKNYLLKKGTIIAPLVDMGIFTKDGKIVSSMHDKYRQINRFLEVINDSLKNENFNNLNIIDFGCGKSYLTFILYYFLKEIKKLMLIL